MAFIKNLPQKISSQCLWVVIETMWTVNWSTCFKKNKILVPSALEKFKKSDIPDLPKYSVTSKLSKISPVTTILPTILLDIPAITEFHKWSYHHSVLCAVHRPGTETTECLCGRFYSRVRKQAEILWSCDRYFPCKQLSHRNYVNVVIKEDGISCWWPFSLTLCFLPLLFCKCVNSLLKLA